MIAWIILFRLSHYGAFMFDVRHYLSKPVTRSVKTVGTAAQDAENADIV